MSKGIQPDGDFISRIMQMYRSGTLPESITESGTSTSCIHVVPKKHPPSGYPSFTVFAWNDYQIEAELRTFAQQGYVFNVNDVSVTCSIHQNRLRDAKKSLLTAVTCTKPSVYELQKVISDLGVALNIQIDKDPRIFGNPAVRDSINVKLRVLGLEHDNKKLYRKHENLNRFYNATKHAKKPENRRLQDLLKGPDGRLITIDYFETVRRIFRWYYRKHAGRIPDWKELRSVNWSYYHVSYRFLYARLWP